MEVLVLTDQGGRDTEGISIQRRTARITISISKLRSWFLFLVGFLSAMVLFGATKGAAIKLNNDVSIQPTYTSDNPNIRDGVIYSWPYVPTPEESKPTTKVAIASIQAGETITIPLPKVEVKNNVLCSCVQAINDHFGTNFKTTDANHLAKSIPINSKTPAAMGFVITYESRPGTVTGHIGHYYLDGDEIVIDWESNYDRCAVTSGRRLRVGSSLIKGYIN